MGGLFYNEQYIWELIKQSVVLHSVYPKIALSGASRTFENSPRQGTEGSD